VHAQTNASVCAKSRGSASGSPIWTSRRKGLPKKESTLLIVHHPEAERHATGFYEKMNARYVRDSEPRVWRRISPIMAFEIAQAEEGDADGDSDRGRSVAKAPWGRP
jgi:hypothetical protein